jgi:hypothetical protein
MNLPLAFEPNWGQADHEVNFVAHAPGYEILLTSQSARLELPPANSAAQALRCQGPGQAGQTGQGFGWAELRMDLIGANARAKFSTLDAFEAKSNYFIGSDPDHWRTAVSNFGRVKYAGVYPGIDLVYYGTQQQLEYDFAVSAGADPGRIRLRLVEGRHPAHLHLNGRGGLVVKTRAGMMTFHKPRAYQVDGTGKKRFVAAEYLLKNIHSGIRQDAANVTFKIGPYDPNRTLIIDPSLAYSTFIGGNGGDAAYAIAVDSAGNAYIAGATNSTNFPVSTSPYQKATGGSSDAFITEFDPAGGKLVFSTYLGGNGFDKANGVVVDSSGNIYVVGYTASPNFPTTKGVFQTSYGGNGNAFVAKLAAGGATLTYSTYFGGNGGDFGLGIAIDSSGDAFLTGSTQSTNFPVAQAFQNALAGGSDAFVAELKPDGSAPVFSSYLGGSAADSGQAIALDGNGYIYVSGFTYSTNFPTALPLQGQNGGGVDAFVTKISPNGASVVYSTYLGGSGNDRAYGLAVDPSGNMYLAGDTTSANFPATSAAFQPANAGGDDAFVAKIAANGKTLDYATYLGGSGTDQAFGIAVDGSGDAYVTGYTLSSNFPLENPFDGTFGGGTCDNTPCADAFVTEVNPQGSGLVYSSYLGGSGADFGQGITVDAGGNAYVTGSTSSPNFPAMGGAFQAAFAGTSSAGNAFATKVSPVNGPALSISPQTINFGNEGEGYPSGATVVTLANEGSQPLDISSIAASAQFSQTNNCPPSLTAGGGSCAVNVTFTPTAIAAANGTLTVDDNAPGSPQTVSLTGTGVAAAPAVTFSPTTLTFGSQVVGTTSPPQVVTLTNTGSTALTITKVAVTGSFAENDNCKTTLEPQQSCQISVTYTPTETSSSSSSGKTNTNLGAVTVTDNAKPSTQSVSVSGTAIAEFSLTATKTNVQVEAGVTSATFTVSATAPPSFNKSITLGCLSGATCSYSPATITPGQTSTLTVTGLSSTTSNPLNFTATGTSGGQVADLALSVSFQDFSLTATPPLVTINAGQAASYTVTVTPLNGFNVPVNLTCPSPINKSTCTFSPASVTPNGTSPIAAALTVQTTAPVSTGSSGRGRHWMLPGPRPHIILWTLSALLLALLAGFVAAPLRGRMGLVFFGLLVLAALGSASCNLYNYGFVGGSPVPNGTAPGVYALQIAGATQPVNNSTKTPVRHTITVNLGVN